MCLELNTRFLCVKPAMPHKTVSPLAANQTTDTLRVRHAFQLGNRAPNHFFVYSFRTGTVTSPLERLHDFTLVPNQDTAGRDRFRIEIFEKATPHLKPEKGTSRVRNNRLESGGEPFLFVLHCLFIEAWKSSRAATRLANLSIGHSSPELLPLRAVRHRPEWSQWLSASIHHAAAIEQIRSRVRTCIVEFRYRTQQRNKGWCSERNANYPPPYLC